MGVLRQITSDISDENRFPGRDLKLRPLKYEAGAVPAGPCDLLNGQSVQFVEQNPSCEADRYNRRSNREIHTHYEIRNVVNFFTILTLVLLLIQINPINLLTLNCRSI